MAGRSGLWRFLILGGLAAAVILGIRSNRDAGSISAQQVSPAGTSTAVASPQSAPSAESLESAFTRIAKDVGPAVVSISTEQVEKVRQYFRGSPFGDPFEEFFRQFYGDVPEREFHRFGLGSGVIIDARGYVLTNEHVIADADKITVTLSDGREFPGEVRGKDPRSDLAVIKIEAKQLPVAVLGDSETVRTGQWAVALGNPFGLMGAGPSVRALGTEPTLTVGVVSALNRQLPRMSRFDRDYSSLIQTDAAINPGNSGGPLLNLQGDIIGINVAILSSSRGYEGVGFAIPVNKAKAILASLIEGKKVVYGWLGVHIQDITDDVAEYYSLTDRVGVLVYQVVEDGPAGKAGMKDGDIIRSVDGTAVEHTRQLIELVSRMPAGQETAIGVLREGKPLTLQVEIGERPTEFGAAGAETAESWRGLKVATASSESLGPMGAQGEISGVVITEVEPNSPADAAGLRAGDVINELNRVRISSADDYNKAIAGVTGNALVRTNRGYVVIKAAP